MKKFKNFQNFKEKLNELKNKNKKMFFLTGALVLALVILLFSVAFAPKSKKSEKSQNAEQISINEYASEIENKLTSIISKLGAVDSVSVFVMVDATPTTKFLVETKTETVTSESGTNSTVSETVVFEKNGSISTPVVVTTIMPKITGVLIVTNEIGAMTKLSIISSVSIVLNIDESRISLLQER